MTTAIAPSSYSLSNPPRGASFEFAEVKGDRGQKSYGNVPLLTWGEDQASVEAMIEYYGYEGLANIVNGTSIRVTGQSIARRLKSKGKSDEEVAVAQLEYKPGKRQGGQSTPASRASAAAKKAAEKFSGDAIAQLLAKMEDPAFRAQMAAAGVDLTPAEVDEDEESDDEDEV